MFNILNVCSDKERRGPGPSNEVELELEPSFGPVESPPTAGMQCPAFNVISKPEAGTHLEIAADLIHDNKCQNGMSGANMNEEEFARAESSNIDGPK